MRESLELLSPTPFEIGTDEKRMPALSLQLTDKYPRLPYRTTEDYEPTNSEPKRFFNFSIFVLVASRASPANGGKD